MKTHYPEYEAVLKERLTPKRFAHSLNVMERAVELANIHGADPQKAELAGLIHDIEKNTPIKIVGLSKILDKELKRRKPA